MKIGVEEIKIAATMITASLAAMVVCVGGVHAAPLAYESFESEATGAFDGTADQTWTLGNSDEQIVNQDLSYSGGDVTVDDGDRNLRLGDLANFEAPVVDFTFSAQSGTLYFSFLAEASPWGGYSQPFVSGSANHHSSASVGMDTRFSDEVTARLVSSDGNNAAISGDLENAVGGLTFVVGKLFKSADGNYDRLQMEFNPTTKTEPVVWDADLTGDIGVASVSRFGIRFGEATDTEYAWIDEIRIGTTWADVLPPPSGTVVSIK